MMIGSSRVSRSRLSDRASSRPLISGSIQSMSTRSGRRSASEARAARQSSASRTSKPWRLRPKAIISRIGRSSSTIRTCLAGMLDLLSGGGRITVPLDYRLITKAIFHVNFVTTAVGGPGAQESLSAARRLRALWLRDVVTKIDGNRLFGPQKSTGCHIERGEPRDLGSSGQQVVAGDGHAGTHEPGKLRVGPKPPPDARDGASL